MFKIKVLRKGKVILGDLSLVLKHGDVLDLDERFPRHVIDESVHLRKATAGDDPAIAILHKDVIVERGTDLDHLAAMEARIKASVAQHIQQIHPNQPPSHNADVVQQLIAALQNTAHHSQPSPQQNSSDESLSDDRLLDIHTKAVQRLTKNTEGHVSAEEKQIQSNAAQRAKDLEGLF
jgi:hypothetical protein